MLRQDLLWITKINHDTYKMIQIILEIVDLFLDAFFPFLWLSRFACE